VDLVAYVHCIIGDNSEVRSDDPCNARHGELTGRRHLPPSIPAKAQFTLWPKLRYAWARRSICYLRPRAESSVSNSRITRTVEERECHRTSAPAGFVSSFPFSSVYWHSYVEAALLQLAHQFIAPLSMVSTKNKRYFVNSNTPKIICGNTSLLRISHTLELDLEMAHIFRTGPLRWSTQKLPISRSPKRIGPITIFRTSCLNRR